MKIGITGSIGCGKSVVMEYLRINGFKTYDADKISYSLSQKGNVCYNMIIDSFGEEILDDEKNINRQKLGYIIFNDKEKKKELENIIHPYVRLEIENINDKLAFVEVPLLYEANMEDLFDSIIVVACDLDIQIARIMKRNGLSSEEAMKRINNQKPLNEKIAKADYVIYNNGNIEDVWKKIEKIIKGVM